MKETDITEELYPIGEGRGGQIASAASNAANAKHPTGAVRAQSRPSGHKDALLPNPDWTKTHNLRYVVGTRGIRGGNAAPGPNKIPPCLIKCLYQEVTSSV